MSSPPPRRARRKADRPSEVLDAALDCFRERGFAATRMEDIAVRAGVSKGTVYLYYPSKQAVFEALVRANILPNLESAAASLVAHPGPASAQLRLMLDFVAQVTSNPRLVALPKLVLAEAGNFPDLAVFYRREVVGRGLAMLEGVLARGMAAGEFRPLPLTATARLFLAPLLLNALWQTTFAAQESAPLPPAELLALHAELFLRAIAAPAEDPHR